MSRPMLIPMRDADGVAYTWRVERHPVIWHVVDGISDTRKLSGWTFTDHDGVERFGGETWRELVERFCATATNYGFTSKLS